MKKKGVKVICVQGTNVLLEHLIYKNDNFEIWLQNDKAKELFFNNYTKNLIGVEILNNFAKSSKNIKTIIIDGDIKRKDNWLFEEEELFAITFLYFLEILNKVSINHKELKNKNSKYLN